MNEIILTGTGLLLAHFITDFVLQTNKIIQSKRKDGWKSIGLINHVLIAGVLALLFTWKWDYWMLIGLGTIVSHWLIDAVKMEFGGSSLRAFLLDQIFHLLVIAAILLYLYPQLLVLVVLYQSSLIVMAIYLLGVVLLYRPTGFFIEHVIRKWGDLSSEISDTLPEAGKWIGYLERLLIFIFIILQEYSAIGLLIAAKSILRFRDKPNQHKITEYILIGTLLSFTCAILISLAVGYFASLIK